MSSLSKCLFYLCSPLLSEVIIDQTLPLYTEPKEKMVAVIKKGCAVLDQYLPDNIKQHCHVYQSADVRPTS